MSNATITTTELANSFQTRVESALRRAQINPWIRLNGVRTAAVEIEVHLSDSDGPLGWAVWEDVVMAADQAAEVEVTRVVEEDGTIVEDWLGRLEAFFAAMHRRWIDEGCSYVSDDDGEQD